MKANELMIGDWVYLHKNPHKVNFLEDEPEDNCSRNIGFYGLSASQNDDWVHPIPLAEEILKANGFILKQNIFGLAWWREEWVFKCSENKVIYITDGNGHGKDILYVHELQHALRLCGLNDLAANFRIN